MILLDTNAWLWLVGDDSRFKPALRKNIREAAEQRELYLSPISIREIALKHSRGKLELDRPLRAWVKQALQGTTVQIAAITPEIACASAELPTAFHSDPADRLIIATALAERMTVVTQDALLLTLAKQGLFHALAI